MKPDITCDDPVLLARIHEELAKHSSRECTRDAAQLRRRKHKKHYAHPRQAAFNDQTRLLATIMRDQAGETRVFLLSNDTPIDWSNFQIAFVQHKLQQMQRIAPFFVSCVPHVRIDCTLQAYDKRLRAAKLPKLDQIAHVSLAAHDVLERCRPHVVDIRREGLHEYIVFAGSWDIIYSAAAEMLRLRCCKSLEECKALLLATTKWDSRISFVQSRK